MKKNLEDNSAKAIISWIASNFTPIENLEQAANGYTYCEIFEKCHPNSINMKKVVNTTQLDNSAFNNYKLLQKGFLSVNLKNEFDVSKLMKGKFQDNLEFLQWFKNYYHNCSSSSNEIVENAKSNNNIKSQVSKDINTIKTMKIIKKNKGLGKSQSSQNLVIKNKKLGIFKSQDKDLKIDSQRSNNSKILSKKIRDTSKQALTKINNQSKVAVNTELKQINENIQETKLLDSKEEELNELKKLFNQAIKEKEDFQKKLIEVSSENEHLNHSVKNLNKVVTVIQKERDFYYSKLRDFEILHLKGKKMSNQLIEKILYCPHEIEVIVNNENSIESEGNNLKEKQERVIIGDVELKILK